MAHFLNISVSKKVRRVRFRLSQFFFLAVSTLLVSCDLSEPVDCYDLVAAPDSIPKTGRCSVVGYYIGEPVYEQIRPSPDAPTSRVYISDSGFKRDNADLDLIGKFVSMTGKFRRIEGNAISLVRVDEFELLHEQPVDP